MLFSYMLTILLTLLTLMNLNFILQSADSSQSNMLIRQESCTDHTASYVIYAPLDIVSVNAVLSGSDPDYVALLPSGCAILPEPETGGSMLTVAFQFLVDSIPTARLSQGSMAPAKILIVGTVEQMKASLSLDNEA